MDLLSVGDQLSSIIVGVITVAPLIIGVARHRRRRPTGRGPEPQRATSLTFIRVVFVLGYLVVCTLLAWLVDPDFLAFIIFGIPSFVLGDLAGQQLTSWINQPENLDALSLRRRRADAAATTMWMIFLVLLIAAGIGSLEIYSDPKQLVSMLILCFGCAAVAFLPYHILIRGSLK